MRYSITVSIGGRLKLEILPDYYPGHSSLQAAKDAFVEETKEAKRTYYQNINRNMNRIARSDKRIKAALALEEPVTKSNPTSGIASETINLHENEGDIDFLDDDDQD